MPNSLSVVADRYTTNLDKVVERGVLTADLSVNSAFIGEYMGNGKIEVADIVMQGLGDYSRATGFPSGDITLTWTPYTMTEDRGREFEIDKMDDEERAMLVSANLMAEFARLKVIPEVDAVRFAKMHANAGHVATAADFTTAAAAGAALDLAEEYMEDLGIELKSCILYCTAEFKRLLKQGQQYRIGQGEAPNRTFMTFDDMKVVTVPTTRFYTKLDMLDGGSTEAAGGYAKASDGKGINFQVVDPRSAIALQKHETLRHFAPEVNQTKDAHKWQYRLYHDLLVMKNQKKGIYTCPKTA